MDTTTGLETEYLADARGEVSTQPPIFSTKLSSVASISGYHPGEENPDLALTCELFRLTRIYRVQLEETELKLSIFGLLHSRRVPYTLISLTFTATESVICDRICRDPMYEAYYAWFKQMLLLMNSLIYSWGLWKRSLFVYRKHSVESKFSALVQGTGLSIDVLGLVGIWDHVEERPEIDASAMESSFQEVFGSLITLNKEADFRKVESIDDLLYVKEYALTRRREQMRIAPTAKVSPHSKSVINEAAAVVKFHFLRKPVHPLFRCCLSSSGSENIDLYTQLSNLVQRYAAFECSLLS